MDSAAHSYIPILKVTPTLHERRLKFIAWMSQKNNHTAIFRSSHQRCSIKTGALKNFANFTGKHLSWGH